MTKHRETGPEEFLNSLTHAVAALFSIWGLSKLIDLSWGQPMKLLACSIFGITLCLMFGSSALYHAAVQPRLKNALWVIDHICIYWVIAGTYTPYTLLAMRQPGGLLLLAVVWGIAVWGTFFKLSGPDRYPRLSLLSYLGMGWLSVLMLPELVHSLSPLPLFFLIAGGVSYTVGTLFYATHYFRYSHALWHLFVIVGGGCHYLSILLLSGGR